MEEEATYLKHSLEFRYRKKRQRKRLHSTAFFNQVAEQPTKLIPIRLDLEIDGIKLRDTFTWNLLECLITPEEFATILVNDFDSPLAREFGPMISEAIRQQAYAYAAAVEEETIEKTVPLDFSKVQTITLDDLERDSHKRRINGDTKDYKKTLIISEEGDKVIEDAETNNENATKTEVINYGDIRIIIKLDLHVGSLFLKDQFEWPLFDCTITPEDFSKLLCADLGISGEFIPLVSHSIREQVVLARLNFDDSLGPPLYPRNMREDEDEEWEPDLKFLSDQEVDQLLKEEDRNNRRLRRQRQLLSQTPRVRNPKSDFLTNLDSVKNDPFSKKNIYDQTEIVDDYERAPSERVDQELLKKQMSILENDIHNLATDFEAMEKNLRDLSSQDGDDILERVGIVVGV